MDWWRQIPGGLKLGLIAGLIPFVLSITSTSTSSGAGGYTCSHTDFAALVGGAIAILAVGGTLVTSRGGTAEAEASPGLRYGLGAGVVALGAVQILRGLGMIMGPCA